MHTLFLPLEKPVLLNESYFCPQVPIIFIGFAALAGAQVSPQVAAWVAVFVLPLNSAINPLLYTVSAIDFSR